MRRTTHSGSCCAEIAGQSTATPADSTQRETNALGVALRARFAANFVERFFNQQRLAAEQKIQRR